MQGTPDEVNEAVEYLREALRLAPYSAEAHDNMGGALQLAVADLLVGPDGNGLC